MNDLIDAAFGNAMTNQALIETSFEDDDELTGIIEMLEHKKKAIQNEISEWSMAIKQNACQKLDGEEKMKLKTTNLAQITQITTEMLKLIHQFDISHGVSTILESLNEMVSTQKNMPMEITLAYAKSN